MASSHISRKFTVPKALIKTVWGYFFMHWTSHAMPCPSFLSAHLVHCLEARVSWFYRMSTWEDALPSHGDFFFGTCGPIWLSLDLRRWFTWFEEDCYTLKTSHMVLWSWFRGVLLMVCRDSSPWRPIRPPWRRTRRVYLHTLRSLLRIYPFGGLWKLYLHIGLTFFSLWWRCPSFLGPFHLDYYTCGLTTSFLCIFY